MEVWIMDNSKRENELKELSQAIVEALTHNEEVMAMLSDLKDRNVIDSTTLLGLALKISDLLEISGMAFTHEEVARQVKHELSGKVEEKVAKNVTTAPERRLEKIDGRTLSKNEIAFQEWANQRFDEKEWLKGHSILW